MADKKEKDQTFLAFLFVGVLMFGFVGVYYVDAYYEATQPTELLWVSDSDADVTRTYENINYPYSTYDYWATGQFSSWSGTHDFLGWNRTGVYTGNNTWSYSANATSGTYTNYNVWIFDMPDVSNWIIDSVNITFTQPGDSGMKMNTGFFFPVDDAITYDDGLIHGVGIDQVYSFGVDSPYTRNINVPLADALNIINAGNQPGVEPVLRFAFYDDSGAGITDYAFSINIEIHGYKVDATSMLDQISIVIGIAVILLAVTVIYIQDKFDVGGYVKDIRKARK